MSVSLDELRASLVRMHGLGLRGGLAATEADSLVRALDGGTGVGEVAARVGLDRRLAETVTQAGVADAPTVLSRLLPTLSAIESKGRELRSAGIYPLVLAASVLFAGVVAGGIGMPALRRMPAAGADTGLGVSLAVVLAVALLGLLSVAVLSRARLPFVSAGWALCDGFAFADCLAVLTSAGVPLPDAVRAAAVWTRGPARAAAEAFARDLEAGRSALAEGPLLASFEAGLLGAAAERGTAAETAAALAEHRRIRLDRALPIAVLRIQSAALVLAGLALLAVAGTFYWEYVRVVSG